VLLVLQYKIDDFQQIKNYRIFSQNTFDGGRTLEDNGKKTQAMMRLSFYKDNY